MDAGKARQPSNFFVQLGVVLHCAGAERIEAGVGGVIALGQVREVPDDFRLRQLRQGQDFAPGDAGKQRIHRLNGDIAGRQLNTQASGATQLKTVKAQGC